MQGKDYAHTYQRMKGLDYLCPQQREAMQKLVKSGVPQLVKDCTYTLKGLDYAHNRGQASQQLVKSDQVGVPQLVKDVHTVCSKFLDSVSASCLCKQLGVYQNSF